MSDFPEWKPGDWGESQSTPLEDMKAFRDYCLRGLDRPPPPRRYSIPAWVAKLAGIEPIGGRHRSMIVDERTAVEVFMAADAELRKRGRDDD